MDLDRYRSIRSFRERLAALPGVSRVVGPALLVEHAFGRLTGRSGPRPPESAVDIGETLELVRSREGAFGINQLLSGDYRRVRMLLFYGTPGESPQERAATVRAIEGAVGRFGTHNSWGEARLAGRSYERRAKLEWGARRFGLSLLLFLPAVFFTLYLLERSLKRAALVVLPILVATLVYGGLHGLLGVPFRFATVLGLAFLLGVSADDAVYVMYSSRGAAAAPAHARRAVIQTTLLLMVGLLPVLFGTFRALQEMVVLIYLGLGSATFVTLTLLPRLLRERPDASPTDFPG